MDKKINLKQIAQEIMNDVYTDKTTGAQASGAEILKQGLIANIANPDGKNWAKAIVLMRELIGDDEEDDEDDEDDEL